MTQLKSVPQAIPYISLFVPPELTCRLAWSKSTRRMLQKQSWQHQEGTRTSRGALFFEYQITCRPMLSSVKKHQHGNSHQTESMVKGKIWTIPHFSSKHHSTTGSRTSRRRRAMLWRHLTRLDLVFLSVLDLFSRPLPLDFPTNAALHIAAPMSETPPAASMMTIPPNSPVKPHWQWQLIPARPAARVTNHSHAKVWRSRSL